jgi:YD repeat-containing protein
LRIAGLFIVSALALVAGGWATAEDRTETISDSKGSKDLVYSDDALVEERSYDLKGTLIEERIFDEASLPVETRIYVREGARLIRIDATDASGDPAGSRAYRYDRYGRLLGVSSEGSLGEGSAGMIASGGSPQGAWVSGARRSDDAKPLDGDKPLVETTVLGYDGAGRATIIQSMLDGAAIAIEKREYGENGFLVSVKLEDKKSGLISELAYDAKGLLATRIDTPAKGLPVKTEYAYDGSDRLTEEKSIKGGHRSAKAYEYSESGALSRVETRRDGEIVLAVTYIENGRIEEIYDEGVVFVKATYVGGRKVKDEFYADGDVLRTREY